MIGALLHDFWAKIVCAVDGWAVVIFVCMIGVRLHVNVVKKSYVLLMVMIRCFSSCSLCGGGL